jgi:hypothetical protein
MFALKDVGGSKSKTKTSGSASVLLSKNSAASHGRIPMYLQIRQYPAAIAGAV